MGNALLDFRKLLKLLAKLYGENEFDTRTVAEDLQHFFQQVDDPEVRSRLLERITPKLISNDLRRLYMMGFLRRRKVPRECESKKGKRYNCGYKYMYSINNQGWSYLRKLVKNEEKHSLLFSTVSEDIEEILEKMRVGMMKLKVVTALEKGNIELAMILWDLYGGESEKKFQSRGFRRFIRKKELFKMDTNCWMNMFYLGRQIFSLKREIRLKDLMIDQLKRELEACIKSKRVGFREILEMSKNLHPINEEL